MSSRRNYNLPLPWFYGFLQKQCLPVPRPATKLCGAVIVKEAARVVTWRFQTNCGGLERSISCHAITAAAAN